MRPRRSHRGHVDQGRMPSRAPPPARRARDHGAERVGVGDHHDYGIRVARSVGRTRRAPGAQLDERLRLPGSPVPDDDLVPGREQLRGDAAAHGPEPDDSDPAHARSLAGHRASIRAWLWARRGSRRCRRPARRRSSPRGSRVDPPCSSGGKSDRGSSGPIRRSGVPRSRSRRASSAALGRERLYGLGRPATSASSRSRVSRSFESQARMDALRMTISVYGASRRRLANSWSS